MTAGSHDDLDQAPDGTHPFDARLDELLRAVDDAPEADGPGPDASRVASHLAGVGDEALLDEASKRPSLRRLLVEVSADAAEAENVAHASDASSAVSPAVAAAALAAFDASTTAGTAGAAATARSAGTAGAAATARSAGTAGAAATAGRSAPTAGSERAAGIEPIAGSASESGARRPMRLLGRVPLALRVAAAVVLVAIPLALSLSNRSVEAGPLLALRGIDRLDAEGGYAAEGPVAYHVGQRIVAKASERLALRLRDGARIVLIGGDEVEVVCDGSSCKDAAFRLDRGEAILSAVSASDPVVLLLPDGGRLALEAGIAHVAVSSSGEPAVSLKAGAKARWTAPGDPPERAVTVTGPGSHLLDRFGLRLTGPAADSLFRDLAFFGGDLVGGAADGTERLTGESFWRVLRDESPQGAQGRASPGVATRASDAAGVPAVRLDLKRDGEGRLAWTPDADALAADRLTVMFKARPSSVGPGGIPIPDIPTPWLVVTVLARDGKTVLGTASVGVEAGTERPFHLAIPLPDDFAVAARAGVVLSFRAETAGAVAWFEGASFHPRRPVSSPERPRAIPPAGK